MLKKCLEEYISSLDKDIEELNNFDRKCCDNAELEVLENVRGALNTIVSKTKNSKVELRKIIDKYQEKVDNKEPIYAYEMCEEVASLFESDPTYVQNLEFYNENAFEQLQKHGYTNEELNLIEQGVPPIAEDIKLNHLIHDTIEDYKEAIKEQMLCQGGKDKFLEDLMDSSEFANEVNADSQVCFYEKLLTKLYMSLNKEELLNNYLYSMGYYDEADEGERCMEDWTHEELADYTLEKLTEMLCDEIEEE